MADDQEYGEATPESKVTTGIRIDQWILLINDARGSLEGSTSLGVSQLYGYLSELADGLETLSQFYKRPRLNEDTLMERVSLVFRGDGEPPVTPQDGVRYSRTSANGSYMAWRNIRGIVTKSAKAPATVDLDQDQRKAVNKVIDHVVNKEMRDFREIDAAKYLLRGKYSQEVDDAIDLLWWLDFIDADSFTPDWFDCIKLATIELLIEERNERLSAFREQLYSGWNQRHQLRGQGNRQTLQDYIEVLLEPDKHGLHSLRSALNSRISYMSPFFGGHIDIPEAVSTDPQPFDLAGSTLAIQAGSLPNLRPQR